LKPHALDREELIPRFRTSEKRGVAKEALTRKIVKGGEILKKAPTKKRQSALTEVKDRAFQLRSKLFRGRGNTVWYGEIDLKETLEKTT